MSSHKRPASKNEAIVETPKKSKLEEVIEEDDSDDIVCLDDVVEVAPAGEISDDDEEAPELVREDEEEVEKVEEGVASEELTDEEFRRKEKKELLELFEKCEHLGGPDFEANHERVLIELDKQKDTIKGLLDQIKVWRTQQKTYNIATIFKKTTAKKATKSKN